MNFMGLLKSLDELLFEVMSWLVFWPVTLWRAVRHPLRMMRYASSELNDDPQHQYEDVLSPPLFLLLSLIVGHMIEVALVGDSVLVKSRAGLAGLINNDTDLLAFRLGVFAIFPLMAAARALRSAKVPLTREALRRPFYAQCYVATPMALSLSIAGTFSRTVVIELQLLAALMALAGVVWFVSIEAIWFHRVHKQGRGRALGNAVRAYVEAAVLVWVVGTVLA
jgi:hypothetical protein